LFRRAVLWGLALILAGCSSYASRVVEPRWQLEAGHYDVAISLFKDLAEKEDNDQLLYLMDLGTAYYRAKRYAEAVDAFTKADKLAELKDYTSVSQEVGSVILNDTVKVYKGDDYEKILVNVYLAMAYAMQGKWESALVECRRVNHKLDLMISKGHLPYERNAFAKYLAGMMFEAQGEYNDAFVDYRQLLSWRKGSPPDYLGMGLLRLSDKLRAEQEYESYKKEFPGVSNFRLGKNEGEIVFVLEQGKTPIKVPSQVFHLVPEMRKRFYTSNYGFIRDSKGKFKAKTETYFDIEATAIKELGDRIAAIAAKKVAGVVAKELIAAQVEKSTDNKFLGALTSFFLHASDQADLRSWSTLPARLQLARVVVPAGRHDIVLDMVSQSGKETKAVERWDGVEVKPGKMVFLTHRTAD
jgi:uncharacterized protein